MKVYRNEKLGFEMDVPDEWSMSVSREHHLLSCDLVIFVSEYYEEFKIEIEKLNYEPSPEQVKNKYRKLSRKNNYTSLSFGKIVVAEKEHIWARYYQGGGKWTKNYEIFISGFLYTFIANCFVQYMLLDREKVWDGVVSSFHNLPSQPSDLHKADIKINQATQRMPVSPRLLQAFSYLRSKSGKRSENLETVIDLLHKALEIITPEENPEDWASAHNDLGEAYRNLSLIRDRAENLDLAIIHFKKALEVATPELNSDLWAAIHNNLGIASANSVSSDQAENIEHAIYHYNLALEVYTRDAFPEDWAMTLNNLGSAFRQRVKGDRAKNLEQAISHLQLALSIQEKQTDREQWAGTQYNLGLAYWDELRKREKQPSSRSSTIANKHWSFTHERTPEGLGFLHSRLGASYHRRTQGNKVQNYEQSIQHLELALEFMIGESYPENWVAAQNELGEAFQNRQIGNRDENIEKAISSFRLPECILSSRLSSELGGYTSSPGICLSGSCSR